MWIVALVVLLVAAVIVRALRPARDDLTNHAIATALGRLVRDRAVTVEAGFVHPLRTTYHSRGKVETRTFAAVRETGSISVDRLYAAVRDIR